MHYPQCMGHRAYTTTYLHIPTAYASIVRIDPRNNADNARGDRNESIYEKKKKKKRENGDINEATNSRLPLSRATCAHIVFNVAHFP